MNENSHRVFSQVLLQFLFVFKTAEQFLLLTHLQPRRLKINLIHSLLVSLSHTAALDDCLLGSESANFWFVVPVCSLDVSGHWGSMRLARSVTSSAWCIHWISGPVFPSLLFLKIGNHIG